MKNLPQISLVINLVLAIAVAVLFYLHFSSAKNKSTAVAEETKTTTSTKEESIDSTLKNAPVPVLSGISKSAKVVFIDYDSLIDNYEFYKKIQKELNAKRESAEKELAVKQQQFQQNYTDYQEKQSLYNDQMKQEKEQQLMAAQQELMNLKEQKEQQLADQQVVLGEKLMKNLNGYFKRLAKENNIDYILSYQAGRPGLLYGNDSLDITPTVLNGLNKEYKKK